MNFFNSRRAGALVLPGVGAFRDGMAGLEKLGLIPVLREKCAQGTPLLGICLGMQMLFEESEEFGLHQGLGLIPGRVVSMKGTVPCDYKIPHIGWNHLIFPENRGGLSASERSPIFKYIENGDCVYFVHSFYGADCDESVIAYTEYGSLLTVAVQKDNVYGCQFHPEKSGETGLAILKAFCQL